MASLAFLVVGARALARVTAHCEGLVRKLGTGGCREDVRGALMKGGMVSLVSRLVWSLAGMA